MFPLKSRSKLTERGQNWAKIRIVVWGNSDIMRIWSLAGISGGFTEHNAVPEHTQRLWFFPRAVWQLDALFHEKWDAFQKNCSETI